MTMTIFYIVEYHQRKIHFFDDHDDAKAKEKELTEKYGHAKVSEAFLGRGISEALDELINHVPRYGIQYKTLKKYYGTVWYAYRFSDNGTLSLKIEGRYADLSAYKDDKTFTIKKKIFVPYKVYTGEGIQNSHQYANIDKIRKERTEEKERIERELDESLKRKDLTSLFNDNNNITKRSPF